MIKQRGLKVVAVVAGFLISAPVLADTTETFDLKDFTGIQIDGHVELDVTVGEDFFIEVSGDERSMKRLRVEVRQDVLHIYKERGRGRSRELHATIRLPRLDSLEIDGMSDAEITNVNSDDFDLNVDGHGEVVISGSCNILVIDIDGHAEIDGREFKCKDVNLVVDGHGDIDIFAEENLAVDIDGHGNVEVYGNPRISKFRKSGMGSFEIRD